MLYLDEVSPSSGLKSAIDEAQLKPEKACIDECLAVLQFNEPMKLRIHDSAYQLVETIRKERLGKSGLDSFIYEYDLSSEEGITLMCLAEAFLRIPDKATVDRLLRDKISAADWKAKLGSSDNLWMNATTWALMLTGKVLAQPKENTFSLGKVFKNLVRSSGEPIIRKAVQQAMKILSSQFVMGRTIEEALKRTRESVFSYSFDMLGEAARTAEDAQRYFAAYAHAIKTVGATAGNNLWDNDGISVKLSALHPRYEFSQQHHSQKELTDNMFELAILAKKHNINLTIDAEEATRLTYSLDIFESLMSEPLLAGWNGLGLAVQAYQKRAPAVIDWLANLAKEKKKCIPIRLVKGAYWDSEIKQAQEKGLSDYPVYTRKTNTDVSYLACVKKIISHGELFFPQFATHNAYSVAAILEMVDSKSPFEFQCLHGMGHSLYEHLLRKNPGYRARVYAPVGCYEDLLPYLVRRLLENGANTSFVNRIVDAELPIEQIIANPISKTENLTHIRHPKIPLPRDIYGESRQNADGIELTHRPTLQALQQKLQKAASVDYHASPLIPKFKPSTEPSKVADPSNRNNVVGEVIAATPQDIDGALVSAAQAQIQWANLPVNERADCLLKAATLLEDAREKFLYLAIREAGKTIPDAIAELREAVDFCRYYAAIAKEKLSSPQIMQGVTGEYNQLALHGRGILCCISPWNFPLAIFLGQVTSALVAGNVVLAKPAEQTPLIAYEAVKLLHQAGVPPGALQLLPGDGKVGAAIVQDPRIAGVLFTGSTLTAKKIESSLASHHPNIVPLIAETGGQNVMLVDSSALLEQVVADVMLSAFGSAGQRCSACRVLYCQRDNADKLITMLSGAMKELRVGDPALLATDIGPVIDNIALDKLHTHIAKLDQDAKLIARVPLDERIKQSGNFIAPCAYEITSLSELKEEVFGPILHVIRYDAKDLDKVLGEINATGYGLTLGIHSRIDETIDYIQQRVHVGNIYVNRNMIGAVVGVQPFGGEGLSGTGPKAGGPHYLTRLCTERTLTVNTTATGGNATLMTLEED